MRGLVYTSTIVVALTLIDGYTSPKNLNIPHNAPQTGEYIDIYAETKAEAERAVLSEGLKGKLKVTVIRPTAVYGPGDAVCFDCMSKGINNNDYIGTGTAGEGQPSHLRPAFVRKASE